MDIYDRMKAGEPIRASDADHQKVLDGYSRMMRMTAEINCGYHDAAEIRRLVGELTCSELSEDVMIIPPFYSDWGQFIRFGRNVFVNGGCHFLDQGGITIGDDVMFGPAVKLVTSNHPLDPNDRRAVISSPIVIEKNAWIGAGAIVLPGVTIGENSVVGAGSIVTKDVPPNTVVVGNPARIIKIIA